MLHKIQDSVSFMLDEMQTLVEVDSYFVFVVPLLHKIENLSRCFVFVALCNVQEPGTIALHSLSPVTGKTEVEKSNLITS